MMPIARGSMGSSHTVASTSNGVVTTASAIKPEALLNRRFILTKSDGLEAVNMFGERGGYIQFETGARWNELENNPVLLRYRAFIDNRMNGEATYYPNEGILKWGVCMSTLAGNGETECIFTEILSNDAQVLMEDNRLILRGAGHELIFE